MKEASEIDLCHAQGTVLVTFLSGWLSTLKNFHININLLKTTGHVMHLQFNIQNLYVLPTHCIYVFCVDLRTNSDYFPIQH